MNTVLLSGPSHEPVLPAELRRHLNLDASHDTMLGSLIAAARMTIEAQSGLRLMQQSWRMFLDDWADLPRRLPVMPVRSVKLVKVVNGKSQIIAPEDYQLLHADGADRLVFSNNHLPPVKASFRGIEIDLEAGFGNSQEDVPADLRQAVLVLAAHWYDVDDWNRYSASHAMPAHVQMIVEQHRLPRLI